MTYGGFQSLDAMQRWKKFGSAPFAPTDLSNLLLWLDAADTASITESGGLVSSWNDKSGNGHHATQSTGTRKPVTNSRTVNGLNCLDFDGTNDYLILPSGLYGLTTGNSNMFIVAAHDNLDRLDPLVVGAGTAGLYGIYPSSSGTGLIWVFHDTYGSRINATGFTTTDQHLFQHRRATGSYYFKLDEDAEVSDTAVNITMTLLRIGLNDSSTNYADIRMCEILIYGNDLSAGDRTLVRDYLKNKWGI